MRGESCVYVGWVVHQRVRPKPHALRYRVFSLLLDVDRIDEIAGRLTLFSHNRWNVLSFHDRDHGDRISTPVADHARTTLAAADLSHAGARIMLLCYPRVLGYGFNPISVYYGYTVEDRLGAVIYEVNNTFGERRSYVVPIAAAASGDTTGAVHAHGCGKQLYVSPFTDMQGRYSFRLTDPGDTLVLGINLRDDDGPLLRTHFRGDARPLTDAVLGRLLWSLPLQSFKVVAAIHFEAVKLWLKGVPHTWHLKPKAARYAVTRVPTRSPPLAPNTHRTPDAPP
jgi:uncharacterized protein